MVSFTERKHGIPIEREFESWIINGSEEYFAKTNQKFEIIALSAKEEKSIPIDNLFVTSDLLIGIQMKTPKLKSTTSITNIYWN